MSRHKDVATGCVVIGFAILIFVLSLDVKDFAVARIGAAFLPRVAAMLFAVLGTILVIEGWGRRSRETPTSESTTPATGGGTVGESPIFGGWVAVMLSVGLMCAYVAALSSLGFIISSAIYVFLQILVLAKNARRNYALFGLVAIVTPVAAYFMFVRVFQVMIPAGILG